MTGAASAAILTGLEGNVLVIRPGQNPGFVPAVNGIELRPGDMVLANSGRAQLVYSSSCVVDLLPNMAIEIPVNPPCLPAPPKGNNSAALIGIGAGIGIAIGTSMFLLNQAQPDSN